MGRYSVKRYKTKRRTRDLDLIYDDLQSKESIIQLKNQELDETKPGMAQFYCIHCAKHFEDDHAIKSHYKSKVHKRRLRELKFKPYTPLESEAASGINLQKFLNSVEKAKERQKQEEENKEELKELVETSHPKGIMNPENEVLEENEVIME